MSMKYENIFKLQPATLLRKPDKTARASYQPHYEIASIFNK